jgi:uncharacterized membrane protein YeaQ/YmgE (transglycosylase-associated protein family)
MLGAIIVGLIVGAIAKLLMPGRDPGGWIVTILLGIGGAWLAHGIGVQAGWYRADEPAGLISSIVGSVILLAIYRAVVGRKTLSRPM